MSESIIAQVEDAMIEAITTARGLPYQLKSVEHYGGQLDDETFDWVRALPAAWVTFGGAQRPVSLATGRNAWKVPATFVLMIGQRNVAGEDKARHGSRVAVGTYQIIHDLRALFIRNDLGLPIDFMAPGAIRTLFNTTVKRAAMSVFALEFHTAWIERPADERTLGLLKMGLNYHTPPAAENPAASDLVTLQGA
jgi:phage gp37-like protein